MGKVVTKAARLSNALQVGSRVFIRAPASDDRDELVALNRASRRFHQGWVSPPTASEQFAAYLERCRQEDFAGFLVCRKNDGEIIGAVNLSQIARGNFQSAFMGFYAGARFAGQGYMTEALQLVLQHAFARLKLHRLEANIQPHNATSIALVKRVGFALEGYSRRYLKIAGRWCDHERWAVLAEDWRAKRMARPKK
ncbi:MAG: GNAT family N-acetyltransferase [bacterium]